MRKSWIFLSWLVGQFEFKNECFVSWCLKESSLCQEPSESFAYYYAYVLTTITLDKIWLSSKFHPVLCVEHQFFKNKFCVSWDTQSDISVRACLLSGTGRDNSGNCSSTILRDGTNYWHADGVTCYGKCNHSCIRPYILLGSYSISHAFESHQL